MTFSDEISAARFLLKDATRTLSSEGVEFVVVGGWAHLFHRTRYGHPGTFDVDVLLHSRSLDDGSFERASETLLKNQYLRAAKNHFQAHRILRVSSEDLVFHVDFLNEKNPGNAIELVGGMGRLQSVYTPAMRAVFDYENYRYAEDADLSGIRFPSPETFIVSKAAAMHVAKRVRDAFDVFVTVLDQDASKFREPWRHLVGADGLFRDANDEMWTALHHHKAREKIKQVIRGLSPSKVPSNAEILKHFSFQSEPLT